MKINHRLFILILTGFLCLPIKTSHAQGNLLVDTSWTVQQNPPIDGVFPYINAGGRFSVDFYFLGGSITQTISTTPDANYDLTFQAIQLNGITASSVSINGNL